MRCVKISHAESDNSFSLIVNGRKNLAKSLNVIGLVNIQYVVYNNEVYVIEVNPRASRTVPYLSKVTGVPMVDLAVRVSLGEKLKDLGYGTGLFRTPVYTAVKVPVFSFEKLIDVDTHLGPEMKSTGEVLGIGRNLHEALFKGLVAAGYKMHHKGGVFITVRDSDKHEIPEAARKFVKAGFKLYATEGTAKVLEGAGMHADTVKKIHAAESGGCEDVPDSISILESGKIQYIISTSAKGRLPALDSVKIRRRACALGIPCMTSIDTAGALADSLLSRYSEYSTRLVDINRMRNVRQKLQFVKMQTCGNDFIFIDCYDQIVEAPESLAVELCDRNRSIGADGIVLIERSGRADAGMRMFNKDGSEGRMAGNAARCVARYLYDYKGLRRRSLTIETPSGIRSVYVITKEGRAEYSYVDMGKPVMQPDLIPVALNDEDTDAAENAVINKKVTIARKEYEITCLSVGNPHCVVFGDDPDSIDIETEGPLFEHAEIFPERINTEFVKVIDDHTLKMRVWERGNGETLACGTGACAAAAAAVLNGFCVRECYIRVMVRGGELFVRYCDDGTMYLKGSAEFAFEGTVEI